MLKGTLVEAVMEETQLNSSLPKGEIENHSKQELNEDFQQLINAVGKSFCIVDLQTLNFLLVETADLETFDRVVSKSK